MAKRTSEDLVASKSKHRQSGRDFPMADCGMFCSLCQKWKHELTKR